MNASLVLTDLPTPNILPSEIHLKKMDAGHNTSAGMVASHFSGGGIAANRLARDGSNKVCDDVELHKRVSLSEAVESAKLSAGLQTTRLSMPIRKLKKRETLFYEGDAGRYFYEVLFGHIKTYKLLSNGRCLVIKFFHKGDIVGLPCKPTYDCYAQALTRTDVRVYSNEQIEYLLEKSPALSRHIIDVEQDYFSHAMKQMVLLGRKNPTEKVASFLLSLENRPMSKQVNQMIVELPMPRSDIADYLGLTQETVCRVLSTFRRRGLIEIRTPYEMLVYDIEALQDISELVD